MAGISLGIDLGTTNSVASVWLDGEPVALPIQTRSPRELLRSVALFAEKQTFIGEEALNRERLQPERMVRSIKTDMGTARLRTFDGVDYTPEAISALILKEIITRAQRAYTHRTGRPADVESIAVTVPARFNLKAIHATRKACELAGFGGERLHILRESDAAALAYIRGDPNPQTVLVYDLGGGTFDISIMRFTGKPPAIFEHFGAPGGNPRLGGDVFDELVRDRIAAHATAQGVPFDLRETTPAAGLSERDWVGARLLLLEQARLAKETVCDTALPEEYPYEVYLPDILGHVVTRPFEMSRLDFEALIRDQIDATIEELTRLLAELKIDRSDIDRVVLAGGSTRIPLVGAELQSYFGFRPNRTLEPDKAISLGACVYAQMMSALSSRDRAMVVPPTYLTVPVGLRVTRYITESLEGGGARLDRRSEIAPILPRGERCPASVSQTFTTVRHRQERVRFEVYVQEGSICNPDDFVAFYELTIPPEARGPRGAPKIDVTFTVDPMGSELTVQAVERRTGLAITEIARLEDRAQILPEPRDDVEITFDEFGNPKGLEFDLGGDLNELCAGRRILLYVAVDTSTFSPYSWGDAATAVAERGFVMDIRERRFSGPLDSVDLDPYDELWIVSERTETINAAVIANVQQFVDSGRGLLIWVDNDPFYADGNLLAKKLIGASFSGDDRGDKVLKPSDTLSAGCFIEHPLTEGLNNLYEGITIARIHPGPHTTVLARGSDGYPCMAAYDDGTRRVVMDTGFTKLAGDRFHRTAGTARYFRNIAFWLLRESRPYTAPDIEVMARA